MDAEKIKLCVSWSGQLEPLRFNSDSTISDVAARCACSLGAPPEHKHFIFKGQLLDGASSLREAAVRDCSVLHLVLNESMPSGRPLHVRDSSSRIFSLRCEADDYVEDVKEKLSTYPGVAAPEELQLAFAGRVLQNHHTLREYNIQKPSMLILLPPAPPKILGILVEEMFPDSSAQNVSQNVEIKIKFKDPSSDLVQKLVGSSGYPLLRSLLQNDFEVRRKFSAKPEAGEVTLDEASRTLTFVPLQPLRTSSHYRVSINSQSSLWQANMRRRVEGDVCWDFFTAGYLPLRVTAIYPRPYSRVRPRNTPIVISFNTPLFREADGGTWVTVKTNLSSESPAGGLKAPLYDESTCSLVLEPESGTFPPNAIVRIRLRPQRICGKNGESLEPRQSDGLLKTSTFRWRFFTTHGSSEISRYEYNNQVSAGVSAVIARHREGKLVPLYQPTRT
mmetsp:Transcript_18012/g.59159  ORF Transcript_18012/g.59159 Transcript_18012/m.59159 type:complete len:447 (-) Transcript_18012:1195-2535(-)